MPYIYFFWNHPRLSPCRDDYQIWNHNILYKYLSYHRIEWVPTLLTRGGEINNLHRSRNILSHRTAQVDRIAHTAHVNFLLSELLFFYLLSWESDLFGIIFVIFSSLFWYCICLRVLSYLQFYFHADDFLTTKW